MSHGSWRVWNYGRRFFGPALPTLCCAPVPRVPGPQDSEACVHGAYPVPWAGDSQSSRRRLLTSRMSSAFTQKEVETARPAEHRLSDPATLASEVTGLRPWSIACSAWCHSSLVPPSDMQVGKAFSHGLAGHILDSTLSSFKLILMKSSDVVFLSLFVLSAS